MKKILVLATVVISLHCIAISGLFLMQGCKTTKRPSDSVTPMPPLSAPAITPASIEPAPVKEETKAEGIIEYIVVKGDSLSMIAKRHKVSTRELQECNKLTDPNKIRIGQKLIIPKRSFSPAAPAVKRAVAKPKKKAVEKPKAYEPSVTLAKPSETLATKIDEYVVQAGDSLSRIAAKMNVKISELREVNQLVNDKLQIGQKLKMPVKKAEGAPDAASVPAKTEAPAIAPAKNLSSGITHTILVDEDLDSIAKLYVVSVDDIVAVNQMGTNRIVQVGQKIIIPQP